MRHFFACPPAQVARTPPLVLVGAFFFHRLETPAGRNDEGVCVGERDLTSIPASIFREPEE